MKKVFLFTDGACLGNPGPGGWAALLRFGKHEKLVTGSEPDTTNNRMEMMAVIEGLRILKEICHVHIASDSKYVIDAFEKNWIEGWEKRGWKTASRDEVKNQDLWHELIALVGKHHVKWEWVKGHAGHTENEIVDEAARKAAEQA